MDGFRETYEPFDNRDEGMGADRALDATDKRHQLELGLADAGTTAPSSVRERSLAANGDHASPLFQLEDPDYLCRQLVTYIGNKRALLQPIGRAVAAVKITAEQS